jgi:ABC-type Fe3+/spermidine/putrescine transport system ATPase subunit
LQIRKVTHRYGQAVALDEVSLDLRSSEILALIGPSGSGKSTLLAAVAGIIRPTAGRILLGGRDITELPPEGRGLGMVFQDYALWPHLSVARNVAFPLRARGYPASELQCRVEHALARVGLQSLKDRRPGELSGGQQQRVALARAIAAETRLLLLDEPLSALDSATRSAVRGELAEILRTLNLATLIVTHDRDEAFDLADRVAVLVKGQIHQHSDPSELYERPANLTVAEFMGVNLMRATILPGGRAQLADCVDCLNLAQPAGIGPARLAIAPERTWVVDVDHERNNAVRCQVLKSQYRGGEYRLLVKLGRNGKQAQVIAARSSRPPRGDTVLVYFPPDAIHVIRQSADPPARDPH